MKLLDDTKRINDYGSVATNRYRNRIQCTTTITRKVSSQQLMNMQYTNYPKLVDPSSWISAVVHISIARRSEFKIQTDGEKPFHNSWDIVSNIHAIFCSDFRRQGLMSKTKKCTHSFLIDNSETARSRRQRHFLFTSSNLNKGRECLTIHKQLRFRAEEVFNRPSVLCNQVPGIQFNNENKSNVS